LQHQNHNITNIENVGSPIAASSPKVKKTQTNYKRNTNNMRVLNNNFQSIKSKVHELSLLLDSAKPDIIIGCETWLKPEIHNSEIMPPNYTIYRNDRKDGYGGVLIGVRSDIISTEYVNSKNIELVAVKVQLSKQKPLIVGSYYRPPNRTDNEYVNNSINELSELCTGSNNATVWIGGDFNLSDISWPSGNITSSNHTKKLIRSFLDTFKDCLLEQVVNFPTRKNKTLDLFITIKPSLVSKYKPLPGLSDHDIVMTDNKILCTRQKPIKRTIYLWKNVDIVNMKIDTNTLSSNILKHKHDLQKNIENIWNQLKQGIDNIINTNLPSKQSSATFTNPWANTTIKKLSRRKKKAYNKAGDLILNKTGQNTGD
jgi:hypothetical protein